MAGVVSLAGNASRYFAAPAPPGGVAISNVTGSLTNGGTLTITGTGMGESPSRSVFDVISNHPEVYDSVASGDPVPMAYFEVPAVWQDGTTDETFSFAVRVSRSLSRGARTQGYTGNGQSHLDWTVEMNPDYPDNFPSAETDYYQSWWWKPSYSPNEHGGSNKMTRVWDSIAFNGTSLSWTQLELSDGEHVGFGDWNGTPGEWGRRWN